MAGSNGTRRRAGPSARKPAWQRLSAKQKADFLEHVAGGMDRAEATEAVGAERGAFRALCRHDEHFEAEYEAARAQGYEDIAERLRRALIAKALSDEAGSGRDRHYALMLYDPEYRAVFDRKRVEVTGRDGGPLEHRMFDPEKLSVDELSALEELLSKATNEE